MVCPSAGIRSHPSRRSIAVLGAGLALACGSERLQTASEPVDAGVGDAAPGPADAEVLVGLSDFGMSYVSGPVDSTPIDVVGLPFQHAVRVSMALPPANPWDAQLIVPLTRAVELGELLQVSFWVRCEAPGPHGSCDTEFVFERASEPWEKSVVFAATAGDEWAEKTEYFWILADYAAGEAHMLFRLGYSEQVIELGGLVVQRIAAP